MSSENKAQSQLLAIEFIKVLYTLIYTARIHKDNNKLVKDCLINFKGILDKMTKEVDLKIQIWRERFHFGGEKLRPGRDTLNINNEMINYFASRGIGGFYFLKTSQQATFKDLMILIRLLDVSIKHENTITWFNSKFEDYGLSWVQVLKKQEEDRQDSENGSGMERQKRAKNAYILALDTVKKVADKAAKGIAGVLKARRVAQTIVDLIHEDRSLILGLATIQEYDDYTYAHSVNVSLLATCLGKQIGLPKVLLEHLSVCGLFHDLGKVEVPKDIILKRGKLSDKEWKNIQRHPLLGVKKILRLNAYKELRSKIILGPFEHHLNPDMTGYPKTHFMKRLSLSGRILRIVDVYEALTADRRYRQRSFTPNEALRKMWSEGEKNFDVILLKNFIQMMGVFPIGSTVELSNGKFAMVMDYPDGPQALPNVMFIEKDKNGGMSQGQVIKLMNKPQKYGAPEIKIVRSVIPSSIGVSVAGFFLNEQ